MNLKIGIVCYPTFGGSGVVATELGKALADAGHRVHFITYNQPVRLVHFHANISYHEVAVPDYPLFEFVPYENALTSKIVDVAKYEMLDILHVHYAIPHASAAYLAQQILHDQSCHLPIITTLHGTDITLVGKNPSYNPVVTFAINHSNGVTAVSQSLKDETLQSFKIRNHIEVIPNFIDLTRFSKLPKDHFKKAIAPNGEKIIVHTSNFRKVKRTEDVIYAFEKIVKKVPSKLLMIGDGPDREKAELLCRNLGVCDDIRYLGKQEMIEEILSVCDLFFMPSETESFGLAALEAMACQVPVISTNTGGLPELNRHGITGFLSNIGDIEDMATHAIALLSNNDLLLKFKRAARAHAETFDIRLIMPRYVNFYEHVLNNYKKGE